MRKQRLTAALLALLLAVGLGGCKKETGGAIVSASRYIGQARGFYVAAGDEFPLEATLEGQRQELDRMVRLAADNKLNSIFFEARPGATAYYSSRSFPLDRSVAVGEDKKAFDPLGYLCQQAAGNKVQVFAVVDALSLAGGLPDGEKNPLANLGTAGDGLDPTDEKLHKLAAEDAAALVKNYELAGVVLDGLDAAFMQDGATAGVEALVRAVSAAVKKVNATVAVGVAFDACNEHNALTVETVQRLAAEGVINMVMPRITSTLDQTGDYGYLAVTQRWSQAELGLADLYTLNVRDSRPDADPYELQNQLLANAMNSSISGAVLAPYADLTEEQDRASELLTSLLAAGRTQPQLPDLTVSQALAVGYPQSGATVYDKSIWMMGTSDPGQPLTLDGEEVARGGALGTFGVAVSLEPGENSFRFVQGDATVTVKVNRAQQSNKAEAISKITEGSLFPTAAFGVDSNETFEVSCVGPSGASITATLDGVTVVLAQSGSVGAGLPATFKGSFTMSGYPDDQVVNTGKVTYVVSYNGSHDVQKSEGEVFVAGKTVPLVVEVLPEQYVASALTDIANEDNFVRSLKAGARVAVTGKAYTTRSGNRAVAYKLPSGEFLMAGKVSVVTDAAKCVSDITEITKDSGKDWESYAFGGGQPAVLADRFDDKLVLRFLTTKMTADPVAAIQGGLIDTVTRTDTKDGVELTLTFEAGSLWGYDIVHEDEKTTLFLRRTPEQGTTFGKPLEGVTVLLDPGHGGSDPGAMGVAGPGGPAEADLNMAVAVAAKFRLEQLGAQVTLTRTAESERVSLDARTFQAQQERPHIFLAIHHNSTVLVNDLTDVRRMEAYYWEQAAQPLADHLMRSLTHTLGRKPTDPENAYYYVTRVTMAPAVLFELGFVVNPAEYEESCSLPSVYRAANGIAEAVLETMFPEDAAQETQQAEQAETTAPAEQAAQS